MKAITYIGVLLTMAGLITVWIKNWRDTGYNRSQFYLEKIIGYFHNAGSLISSDDNNSVKWHQAADLLKTGHNRLALKLKIKEHKNIYVTELKNTAYSILNNINKIEDHRFFYGLKNWDMEESEEGLYNESNPKYSMNKTRRISVESLTIICDFIHKANAVHYLAECVEESQIKTYEEIFNELHFNKPLNSMHLPDDSANPKIIVDYINKFNSFGKNRVDSKKAKNKSVI